MGKLVSKQVSKQASKQVSRQASKQVGKVEKQQHKRGSAGKLNQGKL